MKGNIENAPYNRDVRKKAGNALCASIVMLSGAILGVSTMSNGCHGDRDNYVKINVDLNVPKECPNDTPPVKLDFRSLRLMVDETLFSESQVREIQRKKYTEIICSKKSPNQDITKFLTIRVHREDLPVPKLEIIIDTSTSVLLEIENYKGVLQDINQCTTHKMPFKLEPGAYHLITMSNK